MKRFLMVNTRLLCLVIACLFFVMFGYSNYKKPPQEFYQIKIYHLKNAEQEKSVDDYLRNAFLPALHKTGISKVGVFKPIANDTAADKLIYVLIPLKSMDQLLTLPVQLEKDADYNNTGSAYLNAVYNNASYARIESILLKAFRFAPQMQLPKLSSTKTERIYELRSYESPTEKLYLNKVHMFNEGGEIPLFARLGFNAVFYADVINGSHMPNLMYMTSFENKAIHDEKWKAFGSDPEWKKLSAMPEYQHNVSKADIILMHATDYSDIY
jgi:NIPSNAP